MPSYDENKNIFNNSLMIDTRKKINVMFFECDIFSYINEVFLHKSYMDYIDIIHKKGDPFHIFLDDFMKGYFNIIDKNIVNKNLIRIVENTKPFEFDIKNIVDINDFKREPARILHIYILYAFATYFYPALEHLWSCNIKKCDLDKIRKNMCNLACLIYNILNNKDKHDKFWIDTLKLKNKKINKYDLLKNIL